MPWLCGRRAGHPHAGAGRPPGPRTGPGHVAPGPGSAAVRGRPHRRRGDAQARPAGDGPDHAVGAAGGLHLVQPAEVGHDDLADGRPPRAVRPRRAAGEPVLVEHGQRRLQLHRLHRSQVRRDRAGTARGDGSHHAQKAHRAGPGDHRRRPTLHVSRESQVHLRLQQPGVGSGHDRRAEGDRDQELLDVRRGGAQGRAEGHGAQRPGPGAGDQSALHQREGRLLDHRADLGPAGAHRAGRPAAALGRPRLHMAEPDHDRRDAQAGDAVA